MAISFDLIYCYAPKIMIETFYPTIEKICYFKTLKNSLVSLIRRPLNLNALILFSCCFRRLPKWELRVRSTDT